MNEIKGLPFNLFDQISRIKFQNKLVEWLNDDKEVHKRYWEEWNEIDERLNGDRVPIGFTTSHSEVLQAKNDPNSRKFIIKEYVPVNRIRPNHESVLGDFVVTRRRLVISARHPSYRNIARVFQERIKYIEDEEMLPEMIYFPAMDGAFSLGIHFINIMYNPYANKLSGKFDFTEHNVRDVLIDARSSGSMYQNMRRITVKYQYDREQARLMFQNMPLYDDSKWVWDNEYDEPWSAITDGSNQKQDKATFYLTQFKWPVQTYYIGSTASNKYAEITEEDYYAFLQDPELKDFVYKGQIEDRIFGCLYNSAQGVFHLQRYNTSEFTIIPLINIKSNKRLYPIGDVSIYMQLNDLLDVLVTVFLENAKRSNIPLVPVDPAAVEDYAEQIENAIRNGGALPGATSVYYAQPVNQALIMLVPWVLGWIQDSVSKHSASMGELPAKQVAKETIQTLIAKDRQSHGRKDVMLRYTLTRIAQTLVELINTMETESDYFECVDPKVKGFKYIPINQKWTEQEYLASLAEIAGLPVPQDEQQRIVFQEMLKDVRKKFEDEFDVKVKDVEGFIVDGIELTQDRLTQMIEMSGMPAEDFIALYKPKPTMLTIYEVNNLTQDINLKVKYSIDDDYENDKTYQSNLALMLNQRNAMSRLDMLRRMGIENAEQLIENVDAESQMIQLAKAIAANPQLMQIVQQLLANPQYVQALLSPLNKTKQIPANTEA